MPEATPSIPDYTLLRPVGKGSYGEVWLARGVTGLYRAVKIVYRAAFEHDRPYEREFAGIKSFEPISRSHENMVDVLHVGRNDEAGYFYYVMELADDAGSEAGGGEKAERGAGERPPVIANSQTFSPASYRPKTLKEALERSGRMSLSEFLPISLGLARAVAHLHGHGLIHRDIKPSNIIFVNGAPKVADIGLVSAVEESRSFVGTEGFVPPEGPGTPSADVFSLGKLFYEMSTGRDRLDFPKLPVDFETIPDRAGLVEFNEVLLKACDPERSRRYHSAQELLNDLLLLQAGKSVRRLRLMESRFALAIKIAAVASVLTLIAVSAWLWTSRQASEARKNFAVSEKHRLRAEAALRDAQLNQIRADRQTGWAGQRFDTLDKLRQAAAGTNSLALRNEAIACLAQPDARLLRTLPFHHGLVFEWDGLLKRYATNDDAGNIFVRSADDDRLLQVLPTPGPKAFRFGFSPNDLMIGASYVNATFLAWKLDRQPSPVAVDGLPAPPFAALGDDARPRIIRLPHGAYSGTSTPDSRALAVQCQDGSLHFVNATNGTVERKLDGPFPRGPIRFSPSGQKFCTGRTNEVFIHRADTGELLFTLTHPHSVTGWNWHPDGRRLATSCMDYKVRLWDSVTGQQVSGFEDHEAEAVGVVFDASGTLLASVSWDNTTRLWNPETARPLVRIVGGGNGLRLSADGRRLAYSTWDHSRVHLLEIAPAREMISLQRFVGIYSVAFSTDGTLLAASSVDGVQLWQLPFFSPIATLPAKGGLAPAFHAGGQSLFTCGYSGVHEWPIHCDWERGEFRAGPVRVMGESDMQPQRTMSLAADGNLILSLSEDGFWIGDRTGARKHRRKLGPGRPALGALSPDGRWVATSDRIDGLSVWSADGLGFVTNLLPVNVNPCRFSADGRWLLAGTGQSYRFWEVESWKPGPELVHGGELGGREAAAFCAQPALMALRTGSRTVQLFDLNTWTVMAAIPVHLTATGIAFSPAGDKLAVATEKLGAQVWDLRLIRNQLAGLNLDWPAPPFEGRVVEAGLKPLRSRVTYRAPRETNSQPELASRIPPRAPDTSPGLVDLTSSYNAAPHDGWIPGFQLGATVEHALPIPLGVGSFSGTEFDVRGVVQLASMVLKERGGKFPARMSGIPIRRQCRRLHFLHGTDWSMPNGTMIGGFVIRYVTGEDRVVPIVFGQDVLDWWHDPGRSQKTNGPVVAWTGTNVASARQNAALHVYKTTWENPLWDVEVAAVDFVSLQTKCGPFLLAITAE